MSSSDNLYNSRIYFKIMYFSLSLLKIKGSVSISSNLLFPIQNSAGWQDWSAQLVSTDTVKYEYGLVYKWTNFIIFIIF